MINALNLLLLFYEGNYLLVLKAKMLNILDSLNFLRNGVKESHITYKYSQYLTYSDGVNL